MKQLLDKIEWPLAVAVVLALGLTVNTHHASAEIQAPALLENENASENDDPVIDVPAETPNKEAERSYWIGILGGGVSPELRSHLGLEGAGILVREVVPDSPADKGGLKQYDVLLTANGQPATDMAMLAKEVTAVGGQENGQLVFDLLRTGAHMQATVIPAERPAEAAPVAQPQEGNEWVPQGMGDLFQGKPFQFRMFGPGAALGGANIDIQAPGNTSVQVQTENGKTRVTVNRNGETWKLDGADPESLKQLPEDIRPMVEGLLNTGKVDVNVDVQRMLPDLTGWLEGFGERQAARHEQRLLRRMEAMQRQLEALHERLGVEPPADPALDADAGEAPPFEPAAPAVEVEIPAESE